MNTYKVMLIGDAKTGKTTFARNCIGVELDEEYRPTIGVEVHPFRLNDNVCYNLWDCAGDPKFGGLRDGYCIGADAAIIFGNSIKEHVEAIRKVAPNAKIILAGEANTTVKQLSLLSI